MTRTGYYVLVGCALIKRVGEAKRFKIDPSEFKRLKQRDAVKYKNFPSVNWAFPVVYDFQRSGILLPYREYFDRVDEHPEEQAKLDRMRVLIEEEALEGYFKYVATDVSDDGCIYLLYKLKKAIEIIQEDSVVDFSEQEKRIEKLLAKAWSNRGLYPSLGRVLDVMAGFASKKSVGKSDDLVEKINEHLKKGEDLLERTFEIIISSRKSLSPYLKPFSSWIETLGDCLRDSEEQIELVKKLALFNLTYSQIDRILNHGDGAFRRHVSLEEICKNPYLLAEEYMPKEFEEENLEQEDLPDGEIGLFTIDIGMHPDPHYVQQRCHPVFCSSVRHGECLA